MDMALAIDSKDVNAPASKQMREFALKMLGK